MTSLHSNYLRLVPFLAFLLGMMGVEVQAEMQWNRPHRHHLEITLDMKGERANIQDLLTLYPKKVEGDSIDFLLHAQYTIEKTEIPHKGNWKVTTEEVENGPVPLTRIRIFKPKDLPWPRFLQFKILYKGTYFDPLAGNETSAPGGETRGEETLFLSGASYFYPHLDDPSGKSLLTFSMGVATPKPFKVVSQGKRIRETTVNGPRHTLWQCDDPMEEIFLIAGKYNEYQARHEDIRLYVFLREPDEELAQRYLKAAQSYIPFYERMFGPYPFVKFAVVENSRQTGYGMPSFTLLGSRIIRFPFILKTSYPHEILHNWWGNGVYVDPNDGNWSEGLTAYFSDHLFPELEGRGDRYRFQELMKFLNFVNPSNDFPLEKFRARDSMASQAIGYGKWVMILNMLRLEMGTEPFLESLAGFFLNNRFNYAGYRELRKEFERNYGRDLKPFFNQWIHSKGAPSLELKNARQEQTGTGYRLQLQITQNPSSFFALTLPIAVWHEGAREPVFLRMPLEARANQYLETRIPGKPKAVLIDPYHDLFRRLDRREVPASIGQTYGAQTTTSVLPEKGSIELTQGYKTFSKILGSNKTVMDDQIPNPPAHSALWVFGKSNRMKNSLQPTLKKYDVHWNDQGIQVQGKHFPWKNHSFIFTIPNPAHPESSATWIVTHSPSSIPGLIRKLPHYSKYGFLVFSGDAPTNVFKGIWPAEPKGRLKTFEPGLYRVPPRPPFIKSRPQPY